MNSKLTKLCLLTGCVLCEILTPTALANHRSGDFPLPETIRIADFDGDGIQDLAVNVSGFDHIAILKGDGHANFSVQEQFETDTLPKGLAMGDFDKDGRLDLATIQEWGYNIKVNLGDGLGGFTFAEELNGDGEPTRLYTADLNNDGNLDLIGNAPQEGNVLIYFGNGKGGFAAAALEIEDHPNCQAISIGDFNGDGNPDLAIAYYLTIPPPVAIPTSSWVMVQVTSPSSINFKLTRKQLTLFQLTSMVMASWTSYSREQALRMSRASFYKRFSGTGQATLQTNKLSVWELAVLKATWLWPTLMRTESSTLRYPSLRSVIDILRQCARSSSATALAISPRARP